MPHLRFCAPFALLCAALLPGPVVAAPAATNPAIIKALAADAYIWGLAPEFIWRFAQYNTIIGAPFNAFKYGQVPAAWDNDGTNAGDTSVVYTSGFVNFDDSPELVLTVPPSRNQYYVVAYIDGYANSIGSIGTRNTPSDVTRTYLLVGPKSQYAGLQTVQIDGFEYRVMASDTNLNWFLIRVLSNTLIDASAPTSVPNVVGNVLEKFALNTLREFEKHGHKPVYPGSFVTPPPTREKTRQAEPYHNAPVDAVTFFTQLGNAVVMNPIPNRQTGLSGTPLTDLPAWMVPQANATAIYRVPSFGQQAKLASFAPIGLTEEGFSVPAGWGAAQMKALQDGYELGQKILSGFIGLASTKALRANDWKILNNPVGTYPSNEQGYLYRSVVVIEGGVANIALDAVYPTNSGNPAPYDGNHTYKVTFTVPPPSPPLPAKGIYPPMVSDRNGNPKGFWSISLYATDSSEAAAPYIAQTSVLNTSYSTTDTAVLSVDPATNSMTVNAPSWGFLDASTPILFGGDAAAYGLMPNTVYYVATAPTTTKNADQTAYTFQVSTKWRQPLSLDKKTGAYVPIQGPPSQAGQRPGPIVQLLSPAGAGALTYGIVKPVSQLGSSQLVANQLALNTDGSLTLWFGPTLPAGAPASNWVPTPSTAYYSNLYRRSPISTAFQLTLRMYYPAPGNEPPSILPYTGPPPLAESYIPPIVEMVQ